MELLPVKNLTPWYVVVYSGRAHWDNPIDELQEAFCTREEAEDYAKTIRRHRPNYLVVVKKDDSSAE